LGIKRLNDRLQAQKKYIVNFTKVVKFTIY